MKIPIEVIKKAIDGGWKPFNDFDKVIYETRIETGWLFVIRGKQKIVELNLSSIALDPEFWVALGKSLGWDDTGKDLHGLEGSGLVSVWHSMALEFYDLILQNGDTDTFFQQLLMRVI